VGVRYVVGKRVEPLELGVAVRDGEVGITARPLRVLERRDSPLKLARASALPRAPSALMMGM